MRKYTMKVSHIIGLIHESNCHRVLPWPHDRSLSSGRMKTWMRRRGDRVTITTGKYAGHQGTVENNVYQRTVDYPDEWYNGHHVLLY